MPLALHRSAAFRVPVTNCCMAFASDCRIASNRRRSCRIAGTSGPYFCSHSFSSFFTQSSFVIITTSLATLYTPGAERVCRAGANNRIGRIPTGASLSYASASLTLTTDEAVNIPSALVLHSGCPTALLDTSSSFANPQQVFPSAKIALENRCSRRPETSR